MDEQVRSAKVTIHFSSTEEFEMARKKLYDDTNQINLYIRHAIGNHIPGEYEIKILVVDENQTFEIEVISETFFDFEFVKWRLEQLYGVGP